MMEIKVLEYKGKKGIQVYEDDIVPMAVFIQNKDQYEQIKKCAIKLGWEQSPEGMHRLPRLKMRRSLKAKVR